MIRTRWFRALAVAGALASTAHWTLADGPVGSAFTYQGELIQAGEPVDGDCDFEFTLWDEPVGGVQIGLVHAISNLPVAGGRFTVLLNDAAQFGATPFNGKARFLEIAVRAPAGGGAFTTLSPRQELTPAPYAVGLSLPFLGVSDSNLGGVFEIVNNDMGWAGVFRNNNPANTDPTLNVTSMGGAAGFFLNDAGGMALRARTTGASDAVVAESFTGRGVYGVVASAAAAAPSTAIRGENLSLEIGTSGVWGTSAGIGYGVHGQSLTGRGVFGEATSDFGFGVYGVANGRAGTGVFGIHTGLTGTHPGVDGVTQSTEQGAAGVLGRATSTHTAGTTTYGVLGTSAGPAGVGVRGEARTGVEGSGQEFGVFGTAADTFGHGVHGEGTFGVYGIGSGTGAGVRGIGNEQNTIGVWAISAGNPLGAPALRADGGNGTGIVAVADRAISGEGMQYGVRGVSTSAGGVGGTFSNFDPAGLALRAQGRAEVVGTLSVHVLEILGGADLAERFSFSEDAEAGMVVEIDPDQPGRMRVSREAYNKRVAGVISGANELSAGVVLGDEPGHDRNLPVALTGRVWVKCDTRESGVSAGDFLTTSDLPGHAMPAQDLSRAQGAIIGKAMTNLAQGESGMVLVLVNLQ